MDKESIVKQAEDKIKAAAKAVEDFADEVAAPEAPVVLVPEQDAAASATSGRTDGQKK